MQQRQASGPLSPFTLRLLLNSAQWIGMECKFHPFHGSCNNDFAQGSLRRSVHNRNSSTSFPTLDHKTFSIVLILVTQEWKRGQKLLFRSFHCFFLLVLQSPYLPYFLRQTLSSIYQQSREADVACGQESGGRSKSPCEVQAHSSTSIHSPRPMTSFHTFLLPQPVRELVPKVQKISSHA